MGAGYDGISVCRLCGGAGLFLFNGNKSDSVYRKFDLNQVKDDFLPTLISAAGGRPVSFRE